MKKLLGGLLAVIGLGAFCFCFYWCTFYIVYYKDKGYRHSPFRTSWLQQAVLYGLLALAGLFAIWKGRKLYREGGEDPAAKKVSGVLMTIIGIILALVGIDFIDKYFKYMYDLISGGLYIVLGIILAVVGIAKFCAGMRAGKKAAAPKATATVKSDPPAQTAPPADVSVTPPPKEEPKGMVCPDCGKKYPLDQVYCDECGALLKEM